MASQTVSASVAIKKDRQNSYATLAINVTGSLAQFYDKVNNTVTPNWETDESSRPTLNPNVSCPLDYSIRSCDWYWNGVQVTDSNSVKAKYASYFTISDDGTYALTVIKNLASSDNVDPDTFAVKLTIEVDGMEYSMERSVTANIFPESSNGYVLLLSTSKGTALSSSLTSTTIKAQLFHNGADDTTAQAANLHWYKGDADTGATGSTYTVDRDAVNWEQLYRCVFIADSEEKAVAGLNITDQSDNYMLAVSCSNNVSSTANATIKMKLKKRDNDQSEWVDAAIDGTYNAVLFDNQDGDKNTDLSSGNLVSGEASFEVEYADMANIESGTVEVTATFSDTTSSTSNS